MANGPKRSSIGQARVHNFEKSSQSPGFYFTIQLLTLLSPAPDSVGGKSTTLQQCTASSSKKRIL